MTVTVEVNKYDENALFLHEEIATFDGGRIISSVGSREIIVEVDGDAKYGFSIQNLADGLLNELEKDNK